MDKKNMMNYLVKELSFSKAEASEEFEKFTSATTAELQDEFEYFIKNGTFADNLIEVEGYTARILLESKLAVNPYAAYNIMQQLIAEPEKMMQGIKSRFRTK